MDKLPTIRRIPSDLWMEIAPILGKEKEPGTRGRPPAPFREVLDGILYILRTGCQWKALPRDTTTYKASSGNGKLLIPVR